MNRTSFALPLSALLLAAAARSQAAVDPAAAMRSHGVVTTDGVVRGVGHDYSARFDASGVEFTPALGTAAERPFPVRFTMESVRRGANDVFVCTADRAPVVDGARVRYEHGSDLMEVYDVRSDGIEQSFVFATKPAGTGDLVVRGRIATELPLAAASDDGVRYELPGTGGVTFGAVTGVDANGATVRGSIRAATDGSYVEWVLPASFVDGARYPLVLDPLIGSAFHVGNLTGADEAPAVAFDATANRFLVAWKVALSATTAQLRGQFVSTSGGLLSGSFLIAPSVHRSAPLRLVNVNATDRFLVCWVEASAPTPGATQWDLMARSVRAADGAMSAPVLLASDSVPSSWPGSTFEFDVGGDSRAGFLGTSQKVLVVWREMWIATQSDLHAMFVNVPSTGDPSVSGGSQLVYSGKVVDVSVSSHGGLLGHWAVAWTTWTTLASVANHLQVQVLNDFGPCSTSAFVASIPPLGGVESATCATSDGTNFAVAWSDGYDVSVRPFTYTGTCPGTLTLGTTVDPVSLAYWEDQPRIDSAGDKFVLAFRHRSSSTANGQIFVKGLDPATCAACGVEWALETSTAAQEAPAVATQRSGSLNGNDEALVVWSDGTIRGRRFEARSNHVVTGMGGACSASGFNDFATYNGEAVLGATDFELVLFNPVSLPLVMILGFSAIAAPCGSCTIMPSLDILFPATNPLPLTIPCDPLLVGVDIYTQWLLLKPSDCPILPDFSFSNALRFTIGE